jgi:hypothetical protein
MLYKLVEMQVDVFEVGCCKKIIGLIWVIFLHISAPVQAITLKRLRPHDYSVIQFYLVSTNTSYARYFTTDLAMDSRIYHTRPATLYWLRTCIEIWTSV